MASASLIEQAIKAAVGIVTAGIGAYIALWLKEKFDRSGQTRAADLDEYRKATASLTDAVIATLQAPDFLAGMSRRAFFAPLHDLSYAYQGERQLIFHDPLLNEAFRNVLAKSDTFLMKVSELTVPEGDQMTTRSRAERVYPTDDSRRRSAEEAKTLDSQAKELAKICRAFVDEGKRRLRA
ncbi:hypothetical protein [Paraburkholderia unamae]|uniref:Uncharacterized protein n=1 Tax=Paraburkholderia unamae TaxID=219649 RepID=A0ACC6RUE6_9BURK